MSVSPISKPVTRPRSLSLDDLCDVALGDGKSVSLLGTGTCPTNNGIISDRKTILASLFLNPENGKRQRRHKIESENYRIGAYTLEERKARIARFILKRNSRVWTKKVRYSCRKNLAQCRNRVKGRFVSSKAVAAQTIQSN